MRSFCAKIIIFNIVNILLLLSNINIAPYFAFIFRSREICEDQSSKSTSSGWFSCKWRLKKTDKNEHCIKKICPALNKPETHKRKIFYSFSLRSGKNERLYFGFAASRTITFVCSTLSDGKVLLSVKGSNYSESFSSSYE